MIFCGEINLLNHGRVALTNLQQQNSPEYIFFFIKLRLKKILILMYLWVDNLPMDTSVVVYRRLSF